MNARHTLPPQEQVIRSAALAEVEAALRVLAKDRSVDTHTVYLCINKVIALREKGGRK